MIKLAIPVLLLGAVSFGAFWRNMPSRSLLNLTRQDVHFPTVSGFNLNRQEFVFPRDFAGDLNILFVPFLQRQQLVVNTWVPFAQQTESAFPGVVYYELPTIDEMPAISRMFINEGMRAGIPDQTARERTITLYLDTQRFRQVLDIPGRDEVHILLVNREGEILWRTTGVYDAQKGEALLKAIEAQRQAALSS